MKCFSVLAALSLGFALAVSTAHAQPVTGTPYLSNIPAVGPSYSGPWSKPATTITSTPTGLEFNAAGGSGTFATMYWPIPNPLVTPLNPADNEVTFTYNWNSGDAVGGVNVLFALDDSNGGTNYYGTGYVLPVPGPNSFTFPLQQPNQANITGGAVINGLNFQIDPANVFGNYDITYSSIVLSGPNVPEPASLGLGAFSCCLMGLRRRRAAAVKG
jgi:hypothetical protein